jgi:hypothetical protein
VQRAGHIEAIVVFAGLTAATCDERSRVIRAETSRRQAHSS